MSYRKRYESGWHFEQQGSSNESTAGVTGGEVTRRWAVPENKAGTASGMAEKAGSPDRCGALAGGRFDEDPVAGEYGAGGPDKLLTWPPIEHLQNKNIPAWNCQN